MSVAPLSANELGRFAAVAHLLDLMHVDKAVQLGELISLGNCAAWAATYSDTIEPVSADDIEKVAYDSLADQTRLAGHVGPLAYNMIANNGRAFRGIFDECTQDDEVLERIREIEKQVNKFLDAKDRESTKAEQNAAAFDDIGQLPKVNGETIKTRCVENGYQRVIVAEFGVDESDSMSDYYGGRTTRQVVIGYGKGKRESFAQLRKAAATFGPTAQMGPGLDQWTARAVWDHDHTDTAAREASYYQDSQGHYWKGSYSHFDDECPTFATEAELRVWLAANPLQTGNAWDVCHTSYEHRECYSMGAGNYLGSSRFAGWRVSSIDVEWSLPDSIEDSAGVPDPVAATKPAAKKVDPVELIESQAHSTKFGFHLSAMLTTGKRSIVVSAHRSHGADRFHFTVCTSQSRRSFGKQFRTLEAAIENYNTANIKRMLETFGELLAAWEAGKSDDPLLAIVEIITDDDAPQAVTAEPPTIPANDIDTTDVDALSWL